MLDSLQRLPSDTILGLAAACRADPNPDKVDLTVGIYMDEAGVCPVFEAVKQAQLGLIHDEVSKAYIPPVGDEAFNLGIRTLLLGENSEALADNRVGNLQTPGGCGALRIGAEIIQTANPGTKVWVSDPTWPVHIPLLGSVGLQFETYRYYDPADHSVNFDGMVQDLKGVKAGEVVLLHGCCHNPCGADLSLDQWLTIANMAQQQGFIPFVDIAYQGLGDGLERDAAGLRILAERLPELIVAASCSKNMGLYRERTGNVLFICKDADNAEALVSQGLVAARRVYSMPPAHGAIIAGRILQDATLKALWQKELGEMCGRINGLRTALVSKLNASTGRDFNFIEKEKGMFSFLGLSVEQAIRLREEHAVYMLDSSRINVAGVNASNIDYLAAAVAQVV